MRCPQKNCIYNIQPLTKVLKKAHYYNNEFNYHLALFLLYTIAFLVIREYNLNYLGAFFYMR